MSTDATREFWRQVEETAARVAGWPDWMKAGININPVHFETFR